MSRARARLRLSVMAGHWCLATAIGMGCSGATAAHAAEDAAKVEPRSAQSA
jgi:hypothetical protein